MLLFVPFSNAKRDEACIGINQEGLRDPKISLCYVAAYWCLQLLPVQPFTTLERRRAFSDVARNT